jgi:hypothetical protein
LGDFSQSTGLLVHIEDSHLARIQSTTGGDAVYWETTINSLIEDYRPVDGIMVVPVRRGGHEPQKDPDGASRRLRPTSLVCPRTVSSHLLMSSLDLLTGDRVKAGPPPAHSARVAALALREA